MTKQEVRKIVKAQIKDLTEGYICKAGKEITEKVRNSEHYRKCASIFCYVSIGKEPDTYELIRSALEDGKEVYVPKCYPGNVMKAVKIRSLDELKPGMMGIPEPEDPAGQDTCQKAKKIDLTIVPCISASLKGARLGHGAGYYDRYLGTADTVKMCLCFKQLLHEDIPMSEYDVWMNEVITEE